MFSAIYSFHCSFERLISDGKNVVADLDVFGCKHGQSLLINIFFPNKKCIVIIDNLKIDTTIT